MITLSPNMMRLTTADAERWHAVLQRVCAYDFYHLPAYHRLAEMQGEGTGVLLVYEEDACVIALPLLFRTVEIPLIAGEQTGLHDMTSVYGYAGPLVSHPEIPLEIACRFTESLQAYCRELGVVSVFSRLHPLLPGSDLLGDCGEIVDTGVTVSIDLTQPEEVQRAGYRRDTRYGLNRLHRMDIECREVGIAYLDAFIALYEDTMRRVQATSSYFFPRSYFRYLMTEMADVTHLFMCLQGEQPVAGGLFMLCHGIVQYHLSGSDAGYAGFAPTRLLIDTARQWAMQQGAHTLHLGGGGGGQRDSLYEFKAGFSHREHTYQSWRYIANEQACDHLFHSACDTTGLKPISSFFPAYRNPAFAIAREA